MLSLYEITNKYQDLFNMFDNTDIYDEDVIQAYFDTLEAIEGEFNDKAEAIALFIKNLTAEAEAIKKEKIALAARQAAKENKASYLKAFLLLQMERLDVNKIETAKVRITTRNNAPSLFITDEMEFIDWAETYQDGDYLRYKTPEIDKTKIKDMLKLGEKLPFCELRQSRSVVIK